MKYLGYIVFALLVADICGCFRSEVVVVRQTPPPPSVSIVRPQPVERVVVREVHRGSLLGHIVAGTTLILSDCVSLVFPISDRTEILRERFYNGDF